MRAESGFKGDVAARLEGLRDREGMRRLGAVLWWQDVKSAPNSNELVGFQGAIHQSVTPAWRAADGPLELTLGEHFLSQSSFNEMFGQRLHVNIILDPSRYCKFLELNKRPSLAAEAGREFGGKRRSAGTERANVPGMCHGGPGKRAGKRCKWLINKPLKQPSAA